MSVRGGATLLVALMVLSPAAPIDPARVAQVALASVPAASGPSSAVDGASADAIRARAHHTAQRPVAAQLLTETGVPSSGGPTRGATPAPVAPACGDVQPGYFRCLALRVAANGPGTGDVGPAAVPAGYGPADLQSAYALTPADGAAPTVAIVDAYDMPYAEEDLATYRAQYGLPPCTTVNGCFRKVDQRGGTNYPVYDVGWGGEIDLDIQMVSAICPSCHILLVEADSNYNSDLAAAVDTAAALGATAISNSYGGPEYSGFSSMESHWNHPGIAVTVSSGDYGYEVETPAASPHVVAVGGTHLVRAVNARGWTETAWSGAGSGCSAYQLKPAWQTDPGCANRAVADVSAVADPNTGVAVYNPDYGGWNVWGGTSAASPIIASIFALASSTGLPDYPAKALYANAGSLNDVTSGSNGSCAVAYLCTAGAGYDGPTGLGTPNGFASFRLPYTIRGTVTNGGGTPLSGVRVTATAGSDGVTTLTAGDGTYSLGVSSGTYTIAFSDPSGRYRSGYYGAAGFTADQAAALPVIVTSGSVTGINVQLPANPRISGTVRKVASGGVLGAPIAGIVVSAISGSATFTGTTGSDGTYSVYVPAGTYKVFFSDPLGRYSSGYCGGHGSLVTNPVDATNFNVASDVTGVDIALPDAPKRTFLSMQSQAGDWVGDGQTYNYTPAETKFTAEHSISRVLFSVTSPGYAHWWYVNLAAPSGQPLVPGVYANATRFPFEAAGVPGLDVSGDGRGCNTLTGSFTVLDAVYGPSGEVLVFDATFVQHCEGGTPALTGEISYVAPSYLVLSPATATIKPGGNQSYTAEGYNAAGDDLGEVTASVTFTVDGAACSMFTCSSSVLGDHTVTGRWGSATGTATLRVFVPQISGTVTHGSTPLPNIEVILYSGADGTAYASTLTGPDGTWSIEADPGQYTIGFYDQSETYGSGFLGDAGFTYDYTQAEVIAVADADIGGKDADLPYALHIRGTITDSGGHGLAGISVAGINDAWGTIPWADTDADGHYSFAVMPGSYRISVFDQSGTYPSGYWTESGYTESYDAAGLVAVADTDRTGIDVQLPMPVHLSGIVTDVNGTPLEGIDVDVYTPADEILIATFTDASGAWSLTVAPGDHIVGFMDSGGAYPDGYWDGTGFTAVRANAAIVSTSRSDINVKLPAQLSAPRNVVAVAGDGTATISWQAPISDGGASITQYLVTSTMYGKTCTATTTLSCTVSGLTNGTQYQFVVTAVNAAGRSQASDVSNAVTPAGVPGKPTSVVATAGAGSVTVTWAAPPANGSPIQKYTVSSSPQGAGCTVSATACTISGLVPGLTWTFTVVATNAVGDSAASDPSNAVTVYGLPGKPTNVVATPGDRSAHVSWLAAPANGAAVTRYAVTASPGGLGCTTTGALSCDVTGLTNGTAYTFTVTATNLAGTGAASDPSAPVTPLGVPSKPTGVTAVRGNGSAVVTWAAPASNGGSVITLYTVTSAPGGFRCTTTGSLSCPVTGLTNGTAYTFTVTARNALGTGPASDPSAPVTPAAVPGAPTGVGAVPGAAQATVSWTAPASNGAAITSYTVTSSPGGRTCTTTTTTCTVTGLTNGQPYTFTVHATNAVGPGPESAPSGAVTPAALPTAPSGVRAVATNGAAAISWYASVANGSAITGYTVTASPGGRACTTTTLSCTIAGLTNGTWYTFSVRATSGAGTGSPGTSPAVLPLASIVRAGGPTIPTTAVAVSSDTFPANCHCVVYVASSAAWPDALAAAAAAGTKKGPVLFVASSGPIDAAVAAELTRLKPTKIIVVGGTVSVTPAVYSALSTYAPAITRFGGANRFEAAANVSAGTFAAGCNCIAYISNGYTYADALAGAAAAGGKPGPVLLVNATGVVPTPTLNELKRLKPAKIVVLGGTASVSGSVYTAVSKLAPSIARYGGPDRYSTAALISSNTFPASCGCVVYVAAGYDPYPATAGASAAGMLNGPLLLVASTGSLPASTVTELKRLKPYRIVVLGNTTQVSAQVFSLLAPYAG